MVSFGEAKQKIETKFRGSHVVCAMRLPDGFIFAISPDDLDPQKTLIDPFFKVDFNGAISEYSPVKDPDEFKAAMGRVIFTLENA